MGSGPLPYRGTRKAVGELVSSSYVPWSRASTQGAWPCPAERGQPTPACQFVGRSREPIGESVRTWTWCCVTATVFRRAGPCVGPADLVTRQISFPLPIFFHSSFMEIQFTCRVVHSFKACILVVFSIVTGCGNVITI
uniref:Uncharacterized protein n=1 Tax=Pipistrellus kuhlii TaxID=59472 RepID=A0A7J7XB49_PIPKU|nr:hypothetical protein mPipKuh1_010674 [Pipistrellus kuhlii]